MEEQHQAVRISRMLGHLGWFMAEPVDRLRAICAPDWRIVGTRKNYRRHASHILRRIACM
jgi:hypothetical protein